MSTVIHSVALVLLVLSALGVILLVLLQHGKGADMGAAFGSGASGSLFGATGSANFLSRLTGICATVFFASTVTLAFIAHPGDRGAGNAEGGSSLMDNVEVSPASSVPVMPGEASTASPADSSNAVPEGPAAAGAVDKKATPAADSSAKDATNDKSVAKMPAASTEGDTAASGGKKAAGALAPASDSK